MRGIKDSNVCHCDQFISPNWVKVQTMRAQSKSQEQDAGHHGESRL